MTADLTADNGTVADILLLIAAAIFLTAAFAKAQIDKATNLMSMEAGWLGLAFVAVALLLL